MTTQPNWLIQRSYLTPNKTALSFENQQWSFKEMFDIAQSIASKLRTLNIEAGERVAILAPSSPALVQLIYGCMHAQIEMVFLNNRLSTRELIYQIEDAAVKLVIVEDRLLERVEHQTVISFSSLLQVKEVEARFAEDWSEHQTISIMYTSGTTGFPKGVRQTVQNHSSSALSSVLNLGLQDRDIWLCCVPIFHISGFSILIKSLLYGMEVHLLERFDAAVCSRLISEGAVTRISAVSVMLEAMITYMEDNQLVAHTCFETALIGGGPVPMSYLQRSSQLKMPVSQTYGMTETSSQTATLASTDALHKQGSAGKPLFFNQIRIKDAKKAGDEGEICIKGAHVTPGYIGRFADRPVSTNGWLETGDIGYIDEDGFLYVIDRRADLIISGGENIYPAEIESALVSHPSIKEAGVCGIEHEKWGQVPVAFVVIKDSLSEQEIINYCLQRLAKYKVPHAIYFVEQLPRNGVNKLLRRELKNLMNS